ncbi:glycoside hydrolase family 38 N-terminal domain-containing protein [Niabella drilacis]|uniref:Glycosyl hydrolases family 38 N-terminal domain-containing protein n=1 Tax=Niabella drilacis (strain DSM 25811 / CCM 8410 / CCUG 62505 / LMG 26954 / E90) TaxID=1285928 RepID=A0A1G6X2N3_NIADE|nr:hypothetical protein [Niabella drilacis]SDD72304.1 Glycosyl hydrolases family 38 N-terminal domain-containing protein [Niabella drilacis]
MKIRYCRLFFRLLLVLAAGMPLLVSAQTKPAGQQVTDIWIVVKTHFDLGFTDQAANVFHRYRTEMMDNALKIVDENSKLPAAQRFVWTVPGWPLWAQILGPQQDPARKQRIEQAIREGRLSAHALPFSMHTESQELEDLVRGLNYAARVSRTYKLPLPIAGKMTDVPSHSWIWPTLLEHAGIKFLHIGVNPASQYPRVPQLFWWQGPDGSRILCAYNIDYGSSLFPPADWPCRNYLSMIMTGDNHGPPTPAEVAKWRKQYEEKMPGVKIHFGTLDDFARAVLSEKPQLPVVRGDMPDTWIHGLMSMPQASKEARNARPLEPALQVLDAQLRLWGLHPAPVDSALDKAYEQSLLYGEHTWGMNAEYGPRYVYGAAWKQWLKEKDAEPVPADGDYTKLARGSKRKWLQSYEDHKAYAHQASQIVHRELDARLNQLAASVKTKDKSVLVYNALPWKRSGLVQVNGEQLYVADVPANGYKTIPYRITKAIPLKSGTTKIETPYFIAVFDLDKGGIRSLTDKQTGRELKDPNSEYMLGQFLHERFSKKEVYDRFFNKYSRLSGGWALNDIGKPGMPDTLQEPYRATTPGNWKMQHFSSGVSDEIVLTTDDTNGLAGRYSIRFTFPRAMPYIDVNWEVADKTPDKHPEGGWLCFPFAVNDPEFMLGRLGGPVNPARDIVPGTNHYLNAVTTGVALWGSNNSMALCPVDAPLVSLDEPGLWRWDLNFTPKRPSVFVNLYNNMWNTNFPLWQEGSWSEQVRFWPVKQQANKTEDLTVHGWEARLPLMAALVENKGGTLPAIQQGVAVSRKGVLVTAFGNDPDGNKGTLLRLWEQAGIAGPAVVQLPQGSSFKHARLVNLRGVPTGERLNVKAGKIVVALKALAPLSMILE